MSSDERYPVHAPGWAALDQALGMVYPGQVPHQFASKTAYDLQSASPLPAIAVYEVPPAEPGGPEHWHFVTYGLTELFEKSSPRADLSGFGFEVTFRLPRAPGHDQPPVWALRLLQGVGHYVLSGHGALDTGHVIDLGGPLAPDPLAHGLPTRLEGLVCVPDPALGKLDTPHGSVLFLQLFGLCRDEIEAMQGWELKRKVGLVREVDPVAVTDPARGPLRDDPRKAAVFRRYELNVLID